MKLMIADGDRELADQVSYAFRRDGHSVVRAFDGQAALQRWEHEHPDIIVLDVALPEVDGFQVCEHVRHRSGMPIIILSARGGEEDVLRGLESGADDYILKPCSVQQLAARIRAVLRRSGTDGTRVGVAGVQVGDLRLDPHTHEVVRAGRPVQLTPLEFRILHHLALDAGSVVPYARLVERAWGYGDAGAAGPRLLRPHVVKMRRKLDLPTRAARGGLTLRAVARVGYALTEHAAGERAGDRY